MFAQYRGALGRRCGDTAWRGIESEIIGSASAEVLKHAFTRVRPSDTNDPELWFQADSNRSFLRKAISRVSIAGGPGRSRCKFGTRVAYSRLSRATLSGLSALLETYSSSGRAHSDRAETTASTECTF